MQKKTVIQIICEKYLNSVKMVTKWKKSYYFLIFHPISFSSKGSDCQYIFIMYPLLKLFRMYFCTNIYMFQIKLFQMYFCTHTKKSPVIHHRLFLYAWLLVISTWTQNFPFQLFQLFEILHIVHDWTYVSYLTTSPLMLTCCQPFFNWMLEEW